MIASCFPSRILLYLALAAWFALAFPPRATADGFFSAIREDVRSEASGGEAPAPPEPSRPQEPKRRRRSDYYYGPEQDDDCWFKLVLVGAMATGAVVSSPFWGPAAVLGDSYDQEARFASFPYDGISEGSISFSQVVCDCGALEDESITEHAPYCAWNWRCTKTFSGRFTGEWAEQPADMSRIGGRLQLHTASRFGLDTQMDWLREPASGPLEDELWLGDCNVIYRFAQSERAQFYSGIGFNWLDDPIDTNFGFNFTYGADFFPAKPWVVSSSIDWGNLGRAEQFRFRLTGGVMLNRVELYTGYEYLDIDRTQLNAYVVGMGIWF